MIKIRKSAERGHANLGWLDSWFTFSFADYFDPENMGFRALRVINEDRVLPGQGFGTHPHKDMEILTYVLEGAVEHSDSMGNGSMIRPGDVQRMSAGTGITHSEFNPSKTEELHLLQIWILPETKGLEPEYEQKTIPNKNKMGRLCLIASRDGRDDSVKLHQDVEIYVTVLEKERQVEYLLARDRHAWVHVARGEASVNGLSLAEGDAVAVSNETSLRIIGERSAEILLFDLA